MSVRLIHLSKSAHNMAINQGRLTPAERYEFSHLPMRVVDGVPVFDSARMRPDQAEELEARLEQITGRQAAVGVRDQVKLYMEVFGAFGVRVKDVCDAIAASKPIALKYLRELAEEGYVHIKEEPTRGVAGSPRKRYYWTAGLPSMNYKQADALRASDDLQPVVYDGAHRVAAPGIVHHGCAVYGMVCRCDSCQFALENSLLEEERSAARRSGGNQLIPGLELRRVRRERQDAFDLAVLVAAGLAAQ